MTMVKICGLRDATSARAAVEAGADLVGFVFAPTRRYVDPAEVAKITRELPGSIKKVGLFVNENAETIQTIARTCGLDYVELCGDETPEFCGTLRIPVVKSLRVRGAEVVDEVARFAAVIEWCKLDSFQPNAYGGTGTTFDWDIAQAVAQRFCVMVAGGLTPENVSEAIGKAQPWGVDVSSGVETDGRKDVVKIAAFVAAARGVATWR